VPACTVLARVRSWISRTRAGEDRDLDPPVRLTAGFGVIGCDGFGFTTPNRLKPCRAHSLRREKIRSRRGAPL
jgi:hypothetical protein